MVSRDFRLRTEELITKYFRPLRILQFYFHAQQKGISPIQFNEVVAIIDFQEESTKYTVLITTI